MAHSIQTKADIEGMRVAGKLAAECLLMIEEYVKPGVTTGELDRICHGYIVDVQRAIPAPLNYRSFSSRFAPASTMWCVTVFQMMEKN